MDLLEANGEGSFDDFATENEILDMPEFDDELDEAMAEFDPYEAESWDLDGADIAGEVDFGEGPRREKANQRRSINNTKAIRVNSRRIGINRKAISRLNKAYKRVGRGYVSRKRYARDERRERRALSILSRRIRSLDARLDEQEEKAQFQALMAIFTGRIQRLEMEGEDAENPRDTYRVINQENDLIGTLLPVVLPMLTKSGSGKSNSMLPIVLMLALGGGGSGGSNSLLLLLPLLLSSRS